MTRYRCVDAQQAAGFAVSRACEAMRISPSAFYAWRAQDRQGPTQRQRCDARVLAEIRTIHQEHPDYGSPRMTAELAHRGMPCNHKKVEAMMRRHGIVARRHRRRRRGLTTPDTSAPPIPDLVGRLFDPDDLDHTWVGDVTYVPTGEGWLYLASVLDLGSRRLIGYAMSGRADTHHVNNAVQMAVATRGRDWMDGTVFHSARGSTYTSARYRQTCTQLGLRHRPDGPGRAWTTPRRNRCSLHSSKSSASGGSRPAPTPGGRSSPGSTTTTTGGCTRPVVTGRRSTTNTSLPPTPNRYHHRWPHSNGVRPPGGSPGDERLAKVEGGGGEGLA